MLQTIIWIIILVILVAGFISAYSTGGMPMEGEIYKFGRYKQNSKTSDEQQPIEWICLYADKINHKFLLMSRNCLDYKPYAVNKQKATWETSDLRKWLNEEFYNTAFNEQEQGRIVSTTVSTPANSRHRTKGGNDTVDKVFILSEKELDMYLNYRQKYMRQYRQALTTEFARSKPFIDDDYEHDMKDYYKTSWWLRTPGGSLGSALVVKEAGVTDYFADGVHISSHNHVRPVIWVAKEEKQKN